MYSGLVLTKHSGQLMGAHQKIDRVARRHLSEFLPEDAPFPTIKEILRFEGKNGPDGMKRKSPGYDEPWHFIDPFGDEDENRDFLHTITAHYEALVKHLKKNDNERAAFEAAWLAHAVVDGLTPAHHYPYEEKIAELRGGEGNETRNSIFNKLIFRGEGAADTLKNTARAYIPKGPLTSHVTFELGFTMLIRPLRLPDARPKKRDFEEIEVHGHETYFLNRAREIAALDLFVRYLKKGWTPKLSNEIRHSLAPTMVKTVTMLWYAAAKEAGLCE